MTDRRRAYEARIRDAGGMKLVCDLHRPATEALRSLTANGEKVSETVNQALIEMAEKKLSGLSEDQRSK